MTGVQTCALPIFIYNVTDAVYAAGMQIDVGTLYRSGGTACCTVRADATNVYIDWGAIDPTTNAGALDLTKWKIGAWANV